MRYYRQGKYDHLGTDTNFYGYPKDEKDGLYNLRLSLPHELTTNTWGYVTWGMKIRV